MSLAICRGEAEIVELHWITTFDGSPKHEFIFGRYYFNADELISTIAGWEMGEPAEGSLKHFLGTAEVARLGIETTRICYSWRPEQEQRCLILGCHVLTREEAGAFLNYLGWRASACAEPPLSFRLGRERLRKLTEAVLKTENLPPAHIMADSGGW